MGLTLGGWPMRGFDRACGRRARSTAGPESLDRADTCACTALLIQHQPYDVQPQAGWDLDGKAVAAFRCGACW